MLNKREFLNKVSDRESVPKAELARYLNIVLKGIRSAIVEDGGVKFNGFGTFKTRKTKRRMIRNPIVGEIESEPKKKVEFTSGKLVDESLNKK